MKFEQINENLKELEKKYSINQMDNCIEITTSAIDVDGNNMKLYITVENDKIRISDNSYLLNVVFPKHKQNVDEEDIKGMLRGITIISNTYNSLDYLITKIENNEIFALCESKDFMKAFKETLQAMIYINMDIDNWVSSLMLAPQIDYKGEILSELLDLAEKEK